MLTQLSVFLPDGKKSLACKQLCSIVACLRGFNFFSHQLYLLPGHSAHQSENLYFENMPLETEISLLQYLFGVSMSLVGNLSSAWPESETPM